MTYKTTNEWLKAAPRWGPSTDAVRREARCASGLTLSIQASRWHYCRPKQDNASSYTSVEVGFPEKSGKPAHLRTLGPAGARWGPLGPAGARWVARGAGMGVCARRGAGPHPEAQWRHRGGLL